ncbi:hypothetical protein D3C71_1353620 [compost metagenome]
MFIGNIANDLFHDVFQRDDPLHLAIFVDHDGEMHLPLQEGRKLVLEARAVGHEPRLLHDFQNIDIGRRRIRLQERAQQVLGVHHADDVFRRIAPHRHARIGAFQHRAHNHVRRVIRIDGNHGHAVAHHVGDFQLGEIEQLAQPVTILCAEIALPMHGIERGMQLVMTTECQRLAVERCPGRTHQPTDDRVYAARKEAA